MCAATSAGSLPARAAWGPSVACAEGCAGMCRSCRFPREPARAVTQPKSAKPRAAAGGWGAAGALAAAQAQGCGQAVVPTAAQGGSCGAGALRAPQWSCPHRHPHRSRLALFSASSPDASEYPWQKVPSRHRRSPGTIYSPALPSAVMLAPHRGRGRLARPEHPTGHWLAQPGHPRKAQGTASTAGVAVPVDFADQLLPEWSAWAQGVPPRREGLAARDRGGGGGGDHDCTQGLHAAAACGQRFSQAQGGLVEPAGVLGGVLSGVGTPRRRWAACLEGHLPNMWSSSWFASPARHGGHQPCRRLLAATERRSRALATSSTAAAAGSATDRALHHGLWPWAGGGCPGGARPRNPPLLPALRAGQCRQLPAMLCSAKHAGQTTAQHSRGGWWLQPPSNSFPTHGSLAKTNADSGQPESLVSQK